jgi:hypothetical protein
LSFAIFKTCLEKGKTTNALGKLQWESCINVTAMTRLNISYHKTVKKNMTDYILKQAKGSEGQQNTSNIGKGVCNDAERKLKRKTVSFWKNLHCKNIM